ncbi:GGDEF domain-containing protein [Maridesulfovibrio sp.]|uniref:GGDEF domain-containing protein n=1 Tax=Maridesulfovibrio sp. TaxID=2795000 RepID=UPI002A18CDDE|nr:GGDEF domain-containing protein [Maridesulfovibrio sp.]
MGVYSWSGEFSDRVTEQAFQRAKWPWVRIRLLFLYSFTIAAYLIGIGADFHEFGQGPRFAAMLATRAGGCSFSIVALLLLLADKVRLRVQYAAMSVCMFLFLALESRELVFKFADVGSLSVPSAVFMVLAYYMILPPRLFPSLIAGICGSAFYLASLSSVVPVPSGSFINSSLYFFLANGFGAFFVYSFGLSLRREFHAHEELKRLVEYDELTGVCSRRRVLEAGNTVFKTSRRYNNRMSVLMMDIDYFKKVNDDYGHHAGDEVLRETASRCRSVLRSVDFIGRLGGEEFVIILPQSGLHQAMKAAERLREKVCETEFEAAGARFGVSVSIGAAELRGHEDFSILLQEADAQLYRAKQRGRNQVCPVQLRVLECGGCP